MFEAQNRREVGYFWHFNIFPLLTCSVQLLQPGEDLGASYIFAHNAQLIDKLVCPSQFKDGPGFQDCYIVADNHDSGVFAKLGKVSTEKNIF